MKAGLAYLLSLVARRLRMDQRGATSLEYSVLAGFVAVAMMTAMVLLGSALSGWYEELGSSWWEFLDSL